MAVSENAKNIVIHLCRGLAYVTFPIGVFLFALFIISASQHDLDFTTIGNVLLNVLAFLFFFIPPMIILFLHPSPQKASGLAGINTNRAMTSGIKYYLPHVAIIVIFAVIVLIPFFYVLMFITVTLGFG